MDFKRMKTNYSYLGNFVPFLTQNQQRIKNMLLDYKLQTKVEKLPDGKDITTLIFTKENVVVRFLPFRIDFDYLYSSANCTAQLSFQKACEFYNLLGEIFYDLKGSRIALVSSVFMDNTNGMCSRYLAKKLGANDLFGECSEFNFRLNGVKQYFEPVNSVVDFRPGEAKNNQTQKVLPVLIANLDINTMALNRDARLAISDAENHFSDLLLEEQERLNQIEAL